MSIMTRRKDIMKNTHEYNDEKKRHNDEKKITANLRLHCIKTATIVKSYENPANSI